MLGFLVASTWFMPHWRPWFLIGPLPSGHQLDLTFCYSHFISRKKRELQNKQNPNETKTKKKPKSKVKFKNPLKTSKSF
jgi:hypothetical protein